MSLLFTDGFDHPGSAVKWTLSNGSPTPRTWAARTGSHGLELGNNNFVQKSLGANAHATVTIGLGAYLFLSSTSLLDIYFYGDSGTTTHGVVRIANNGNIDAYRGSFSTLLGSSSANSYTFPAAVWTYVEIKYVLHDSTGSIQVRINGSTYAINLTGIDTKNGGTLTTIDTVRVSYVNATAYIDDVYITNGAGSINTGMIGDVKIETLYPSGNGTYSQLTGSDGNSTDNYLLVDESSAPSTSDYNGSATDDLMDTYALANLSTAAGTVHGINVFAYAGKSDAGAKGGAIMIRTNSTDYEQTNNALSTSYQYFNEIEELNPNTSAAWTISEINALEAGFKVKAG